MSNKIRISTRVPLLAINKPSQTITRDAADRITQWVYVYPSVTVTYDVTWFSSSGSQLALSNPVVQTITDN